MEKGTGREDRGKRKEIEIGSRKEREEGKAKGAEVQEGIGWDKVAVGIRMGPIPTHKYQQELFPTQSGNVIHSACP